MGKESVKQEALKGKDTGILLKEGLGLFFIIQLHAEENRKGHLDNLPVLRFLVFLSVNSAEDQTRHELDDLLCINGPKNYLTDSAHEKFLNQAEEILRGFNPESLDLGFC